MPQRSAKDSILVAGPTEAFNAGLKGFLMLGQLKAAAKPSFFGHPNLNKVIHRVSLYPKVWFSFRVLANLAGKTHKSAPNLVQIEQIPRYHPHTPKHPQASFLKLPWYAKPVPFRICREPHQN